MENIINRINKVMQKGNRFLILIIALCVLVVLSSLYVFIFGGNKRGTGVPATQATVTENGDELIISDLYSGQLTIPKFSYPVNTYKSESFTVEADGTISYPNAHLGIDVSEHQGDVDWAQVSAAGYKYALIRAGYRGYTRGRTYDDSTFEANMKGATENGLKVGIYFFSQAVTVAEAEEEASFILQMIGDYKIDYPIVFDWENVDDTAARTNGLDGETVTQLAAAFCDKIKKAGYNTAVYLNKSQMYGFYNLDKLKGFDLWYAEYQNKPSQYYDFTIWQYTSTATVPGIEGTVDVNISFKNYTK
ncbi:MAG: glycoside hydrolase family 25 protein [Clostridia bacterium]|nr:glycoside hydrolase family 25 protein [Clostridia bacterium]